MKNVPFSFQRFLHFSQLVIGKYNFGGYIQASACFPQILYEKNDESSVHFGYPGVDYMMSHLVISLCGFPVPLVFAIYIRPSQLIDPALLHE